MAKDDLDEKGVGHNSKNLVHVRDMETEEVQSLMAELFDEENKRDEVILNARAEAKKLRSMLKQRGIPGFMVNTWLKLVADFDTARDHKSGDKSGDFLKVGRAIIAHFGMTEQLDMFGK